MWYRKDNRLASEVLRRNGHDRIGGSNNTESHGDGDIDGDGDDSNDGEDSDDGDGDRH